IAATVPQQSWRSSSCCAGKRPNFSEDEPLFSATITVSAIVVSTERPSPIPYFWQILSVFRDIQFVALHHLREALHRAIGECLQAWHSLYDIERQLETVQPVEYGHIERRGCRAFLDVSAHVDIEMIPAPVGEPVNQCRIAVKRKDDGLVHGEESIEIFIRKPMRVFRNRLQGHQVNDIDDANT